LAEVLREIGVKWLSQLPLWKTSNTWALPEPAPGIVTVAEQMVLASAAPDSAISRTAASKVPERENERTSRQN
jgi:hypothetical protein